MSYHFWKAVFRGMVVADIIGLIGLGVFIYFNGHKPVGEGLVWLQFKLLGVLYIGMTIGTFYSHYVYNVTYNIARLRNLDRVHPLGNGRRRGR